MQFVFITIILTLTTTCSATIGGPYLFWGHERVTNLQPRALVEATERDFSQLFRNAKSILIFVRNSTNRLDANKYVKFESLVKNNAWTYLPQRNLAAEPFDYNTNIEVINLSGNADADDEQLSTAYNEALNIYGNGEVLGILAHHEDDAHFLVKREAKETEDDGRTTTPSTSIASEETEQSFIFVADGKKAVLYVNAAPVLKLANENETFNLVEHRKAITFDDQKVKGYGRLNVIFSANGEKLTLRFNFTLKRGTWDMSAVEVEYREYQTVLPVVGNAYSIPSAPLGFSYRCSSRELIFSNKNDSLVLTDYQVQPWLNGRSKFSDCYDCVGFTTAPIWAGVLVSLFLLGILSLGIILLMDIKPPNRFESSRNKQLTFTVQE